MRFGVVRFYGSNCDRDCYHVVSRVLHRPVRYVAHDESSLDDVDCVILPGGFSYGDYLRAGAMAARTRIMAAVEEFAAAGNPVIGICNGFQVLCEAGLLPGALMVNDGLRFICRPSLVRVEDNETPFTSGLQPGAVMSLPIAHQWGNYRPPPDGFRGRIVLRYSADDGSVTPESNPNGSWQNVAAIANARGNVLGMMPHPERSSESILGGEDGLGFFSSVVSWWEGGTSYV